MKRLITLALGAYLAQPAVVAAQQAASIAMNCDGGAVTAGAEAPNLHGNWDFLMDVGGTPNFGLLSIGVVDRAYGGSLSLWSTAPVVLRKLTLAGNSFHMAVASPDGDVLFDGIVSAKGDWMCGTVTYHGGRTFPASARKRLTTYQSQQRAQRAD